MDYVILIFLVQLTVYRQEKEKKDWKKWSWIVLEVVQNIKTLKKSSSWIWIWDYKR